MKKNLFLLAMVAIIILLGAVSSSANTSQWFDDYYFANNQQIKYVKTDMRENATRGEVSNVIGITAEGKGKLEKIDKDFYFSDTNMEMPRRLASTGVMYGYPDGTFKPYSEITRAEFCVLLDNSVNLFGLYTPNNVKISFNDIKGHWAEKYITRCASKGLVSGSNGMFRPNDPITREEVTVILTRLFGLSDGTLIEALDQVFGLVFEEFQAPVRPERPSVKIEDNEGGSTRPQRPSIKDIEDDEDEDSTTSSGGATRPTRPSVKEIEDDEKDNDSTTSSGGSKRPQRPSVKA